MHKHIYGNFIMKMRCERFHWIIIVAKNVIVRSMLCIDLTKDGMQIHQNKKRMKEKKIIQ